ncbi:DUF2189 domain-containing protein [Ectothiorhodospira variabilis]|uniref:DUF2189 domain-containing protein n=1 Tax=Ectothiorhodospira variabilis TaxID=505694 RepID=UPI001EFAFA0D|nr:DUF2189 domain-containing protein [Ectothiorhodospira variabilis]MCG5498385.1 DUF2189 domain-containing protein [Ectothiorhodospira variabilis]MCG5503045.1 DUF2189 domain-containing protein [Ectothiorhodospira variabilis]MCG5506196.1 DUF2189 domain-containing protein [Ectothiorhodospira variabilis]
MDNLIKRRYPEDSDEIQPRQTLDSGTPPVRRISGDAPLRWLVEGWKDLWRAPAGLAHGLLVAALGLGILWLTWGQPWLTMALISGFLLVGPALAVGVNELARQLEHGDQGNLSIPQSFRALPALGSSLWLFAAMLAAMFLIWTGYMALWIGVMNVGVLGQPGSLGELLGTMLSTTRGIVSLIGVVVAGAALAVAAFALSVVTVPAMLDRRAGVVDAMAISLKVLSRNPIPMLAWAALITALFGLSVLTALIALILVFPWIGFAMWHGYREMVVHGDDPATPERETS